MSDDNAVKFPFDRDFQIGVLGLVLQDHTFLLTALDIIKKEYFEDRVLIWFFSTIIDYYTKYNAHPSVSPVVENELKKAVRSGYIKPNEIEEFAGVCKRLSDPVDAKNYVIDEVVRFCRRQEGRRLMLEIAPKLDSATDSDWAEYCERFMKCSTLGSSMNFGINFFSDAQARVLLREQGDTRLIMPTGITQLDEYVSGGLKSGQLGIWMGGPGSGKSIALAHCGKRAVVGGYKVLHVTCELSAEDIAERYDASWTNTPVTELVAQSNRVSERLAWGKRKYGDSLYIKYWPTDVATVNTIRAHVQLLAGQGWRPDLIIVDYGDLLKPLTNYSDRWDDLGAIFRALRGLAGEFTIPIWTATQMNRGGMSLDVADMDNVSGAFEKAMIADVFVALCANKEERVNAVMRLFIAKNRNGPCKFSIPIHTAYDRMCLWDVTAPVITNDTIEVPEPESTPVGLPPQVSGTKTRRRKGR